MRVAVASSDGRVIDRHFGRADTFYIYDIADHDVKFTEKRSGKPPCGGGFHYVDDMDAAIERISDCEMVIAVRIGGGAAEELRKHQIIPVNRQGDILDVLDELAESTEP